MTPSQDPNLRTEISNSNFWTYRWFSLLGGVLAQGSLVLHWKLENQNWNWSNWSFGRRSYLEYWSYSEWRTDFEREEIGWGNIFWEADGCTSSRSKLSRCRFRCPTRWLCLHFPLTSVIRFWLRGATGREMSWVLTACVDVWIVVLYILQANHTRDTGANLVSIDIW